MKLSMKVNALRCVLLNKTISSRVKTHSASSSSTLLFRGIGYGVFVCYNILAYLSWLELRFSVRTFLPSERYIPAAVYQTTLCWQMAELLFWHGVRYLFCKIVLSITKLHILSEWYNSLWTWPHAHYMNLILLPLIFCFFEALSISL